MSDVWVDRYSTLTRRTALERGKRAQRRSRHNNLNSPKAIRARQMLRAFEKRLRRIFGHAEDSE